MTETATHAEPRRYLAPSGTRARAVQFDGSPESAAAIIAWLGAGRYEAATRTFILVMPDWETAVRPGFYVVRIEGCRYEIPWPASTFEQAYTEEA